MEREKSQKKPTLGKVGYQLETTALISKWNYNTLRIRCIMLILENLKETFARNSPFARGIPPNRKKTKNGNEISKTMAKSWIKSPNGC
ncbi:hypothetical protein [Acinetobacter nosocomialis]